MVNSVAIDNLAADPAIAPSSDDELDGACLLEPTPNGPAEHFAGRSGRRWIRPIVETLIAAWALLSLLFIGAGLLLTKLVLTGSRGARDEWLNQWLADHRTVALDRVTSGATFIANTWPVVLLLAAACAILLTLRWWREAVFLVVALALELSVFLTANYTVDRSRPDVPRLDSTPSTGSYPSGHVAATLALWCGVALIVSPHVRNRVVRALVWSVVVAVPTLIAFARAYRGMHHVSDVVVGALLGVAALVASIAVARVVSAAVDARREARTKAPLGAAEDPSGRVASVVEGAR